MPKPNLSPNNTEVFFKTTPGLERSWEIGKLKNYDLPIS